MPERCCVDLLKTPHTRVPKICFPATQVALRCGGLQGTTLESQAWVLLPHCDRRPALTPAHPVLDSLTSEQKWLGNNQRALESDQLLVPLSQLHLEKGLRSRGECGNESCSVPRRQVQALEWASKTLHHSPKFSSPNQGPQILWTVFNVSKLISSVIWF